MTTHMKNGKAMQALKKHAAMPASKAHGVKKFSGGGLNMERKRVGRNMAKVMNQRGR